MKMAGVSFVNLNWDIFTSGGADYDEFESGPGNYSVAIVELPDGSVVMPMASDIIFLDKPDGMEEDFDHTYTEKDKCSYDCEDDKVKACPHNVLGLCIAKDRFAECPVRS